MSDRGSATVPGGTDHQAACILVEVAESTLSQSDTDLTGAGPASRP
ncbi:MAG: hypothetical protein ACR2GO_04680 [Candidatus Limnocylindria bacterium]